jgi:nicotinamide-nucleotide amidase
MPAEIIAIGTELTTGSKLDTNSQWLSQKLSELGIPVHFHTTLADDLPANIAALQVAVDRADLVLITGGLGPTLDDLTRNALAALLDRPLVLDEPSLSKIREMFASRNRDMPERNVVQALFPQGSQPIPNPRGTAPGIDLEIGRAGRKPCRVFAMPGVPSEMKFMFAQEVVPRLGTAGGTGHVIRHARINCFGLGESATEELLGDITSRGRDPEVGITVHEATITLRIVAEGNTSSECEDKIAGTRALIVERLGDTVFGEEDDELQHVVVRGLRDRQQTVAVAEVATGGLVAHWLSGVEGNETCFVGGIILPRGPAVPGRPARILWADALTAPTPESARALAIRCRTEFATDYALVVSERTLEGHPGPRACIALATPTGVTVRELNLSGDPGILKSRLGKSALNLLRLEALVRRS